jgi:hypothetical protein
MVEQQRIEAILHEESPIVVKRRMAETACEGYELGTAGQVDVLPVVDLDATHGKGSDFATQEPASLEEINVEAAVFQVEGGAEAR